MNNKEKAQEFAKHRESEFGEIGDINYCCYKSALDMAQWKDEQFSKFILWLDDHYVIRRFTDGEPMTYAELIDNFKSNSYEPNTTTKD